ncbi:MAG TPA: ribosome biogenesis GTPase Der [Firmicutes bacterium]|nr:ribosome biogenesis GTPase Der [Bacillota bacterium]
MKKTVCLVGRPNVGKSTIFNKLIKEQKAIILDTPGITRDRIYGDVTYDDKKFLLVDTGGIDLGEGDFNKDIEAQAEIAIKESDVIVFVVDGREDLTSNDLYIRDKLLKTNKKVIVALSKLDNFKMQEERIYYYYELGFEYVIPVSSLHNLGIGDLLEEITRDFDNNMVEDDDNLKFSIIGRPNVGKSSLVNAILNEERAIVSNIAGTTRDSSDTRFKYNGEEYTVIDTAGMRKSGKIYESVEKYSLLRSLKAIDRSDVCVLVIDAGTGIIEHDKHIASYAIEAGKGLVLVVNKWDLVEDKDKKMKEWKLLLENEFQFMTWSKVVFLSALTKKRIHTLMPEIISAYENNHREVKTSILNNVINEATRLHEAPGYKGKKLKIYFSSQTGICPPKFTFRCNNKGLVHFSYERYLENTIRKNFDYTGTPIILQFKNRGNKDEEE